MTTTLPIPIGPHIAISDIDDTHPPSVIVDRLTRVCHIADRHGTPVVVDMDVSDDVADLLASVGFGWLGDVPVYVPATKKGADVSAPRSEMNH